jgi:DNA topoisomerase IB
VRRGTGFAYLDVDGTPLTDPVALQRIKNLVIPPAWRDVWICPDPLGHLQATGVDAAGRKQYRYHDRWREQEDRKKFARMVQFAHGLPPMRERVLATMGSGHDLDHERVLSCAVRLLDVGLFRIGSEVYEREDGHLGLATIAKANVSVAKDELVFDYIAKEGVHRVHTVQDPLCLEIVGALKRRRGGGEHLLAYRVGRRWRQVHAHQINEYLKNLVGDPFSAKDFRTWNGTLLAAVSIAAHGAAASTERARRRAINETLKDVSDVLGNTPAVASKSYVDPVVFDRFLSGWTIAEELKRIEQLPITDDDRRAETERTVLDLLAST